MTDFIHITEKALDVQEISEKVTEPSTGATSLFIGTTRDHFHGKKVLKLEYEAYVPMAKKKLKELCNSLRVKWPDLHHIGIYHRLGQVGPCEASVIIGKKISRLNYYDFFFVKLISRKKTRIEYEIPPINYLHYHFLL